MSTDDSTLPNSVAAAARVSRAMALSEALDEGSAIDHEAWLESVHPFVD